MKLNPKCTICLHVKKYFKSIVVLITILGVMMLTGCDERGIKMGRYNLHSMFKDEKVAELILAACRGETDKIDELINAGANPNAVGKEGVTPLFWVTGQEPINLVGLEALLKYNANPNYIPPPNTELYGFAVIYALAGNKEKTAALDLVLRYSGNPNFVTPKDFLEKQPQSVLLYAAQNGRLENVKLLVKYGADTEYKDETGMTSLLWAAFDRHFDIVYFLLEHGADYRVKAYMPGTWIEPKDDLASLMGLPLTTGVSDDQTPWLEKTVKWLVDHGVPRPKPRDY